MEHILIIEDEKDVNQLLAHTLQEKGYHISSAYDGITGTQLLKKDSFDLVLLDLMLPYKSGDAILKELRDAHNDIPVIVISAKDMVYTKIDLLTLGADDYITKPFDLGEVAARVYTNLRRSHKQEQPAPITYKELVLDPDAKQITLNETLLPLTAKEYQMLELFLLHPNKVFSKANLYETIWKDDYLGDDSVIKTHISNIRNKIKKYSDLEYIETVWGLGYRIARL